MKFLSRLQETEVVQGCDKTKLEREFYDSLSIVTEKYGITVQDSKAMPFPYNISAALADLRAKLKKTILDWKEIRLIHHRNRTFFAHEDRFNTGMTLYYIPVIPLHTILEENQSSQTGILLLSIYSYLYKVLGIPYYRNDDCYLNSTYESYEEMISEDEDQDEDISAELKNAKTVGDIMKTKIFDAENLTAFETRLKTFKAKSDFDKKTLKIAKEVYKIYTKYPTERLDRKYYPLRFREEEAQDSYYVTMDNYVSFCASIKGNLFECMCQFINEDLQEYGDIDEPTRFLPFDEQVIKGNNFDFEKQVFDSLDDLIALWQNSNF
ncbi:hypothetical protein DRF65_11200 [Chryseobacterium pennae]|uniref:Uncharacterized protein n=2 Tax=Chryseobacterium pennae TaxID=2258962 RepID=A0A3D9C9W9_9FLAO|nr:hypothetical protein DRF65_11200 [Chryseobacterium pennae]